MSESVHTTVRLPADVAEAVEHERKRLGVSKGQAMAALIRQGLALDPDRLLAEIAAARNAAEASASRAEQAREAADSAKTAAIHSRQMSTKAREAAEAIPQPPAPPPYTGTAAGWFGRMTVSIKPNKPKKIAKTLD